MVKLNNSKFLLLVENAIRMGSPLLIEDIGEQLDPALEPVLQKAIFNNQARGYSNDVSRQAFFNMKCFQLSAFHLFEIKKVS